MPLIGGVTSSWDTERTHGHTDSQTEKVVRICTATQLTVEDSIGRKTTLQGMAMEGRGQRFWTGY